MRRREVISTIGATFGLPAVALAQQAVKTFRIGITTIQPRTAPIYAAFDQRLRELGYVEGVNLIVDFLNPEDQTEGIAGAINELVRRKVDVIVAPYESALKSALTATESVPIVMIAIDYDPLARGYIAGLSRPGRNVTGLSLQQIELAKKRLQILTDALPSVRTATMFWDSFSKDQWDATNSSAGAHGLRLAGAELREQPYNYESAWTQAPPDHRAALIVAISPTFYRDRQRLVDFTIQRKIPSVYALREWVEAGGLLSYGVNFPATFRRVADYVDRIAKGAKPAELPIEQPTKFELVVNLKTAKAIGFPIPTEIIARADEVIE